MLLHRGPGAGRTERSMSRSGGKARAAMTFARNRPMVGFGSRCGIVNLFRTLAVHPDRVKDHLTQRMLQRKSSGAAGSSVEERNPFLLATAMFLTGDHQALALDELRIQAAAVFARLLNHAREPPTAAMIAAFAGCMDADSVVGRLKFMIGDVQAQSLEVSREDAKTNGEPRTLSTYPPVTDDEFVAAQDAAYVASVGGNTLPGHAIAAVAKGDIVAIEAWLDGDSGHVDARCWADPNGCWAAANVEARDVLDAGRRARGSTMLAFTAGSANRETFVEMLLRRGATVDLQNSTGVSALMEAADNNQPAIVRLLLQAGAQMGLRDWADQTAPQIAERKGYTECVGAFREHLLALAAERRAPAHPPAATTAVPAATTKVSAAKTEVAAAKTSASAATTSATPSLDAQLAIHPECSRAASSALLETGDDIVSRMNKRLRRTADYDLEEHEKVITKDLQQIKAALRDNEAGAIPGVVEQAKKLRNQLKKDVTRVRKELKVNAELVDLTEEVAVLEKELEAGEVLEAKTAFELQEWKEKVREAAEAEKVVAKKAAAEKVAAGKAATAEKAAVEKAAAAEKAAAEKVAAGKVAAAEKAAAEKAAAATAARATAAAARAATQKVAADKAAADKAAADKLARSAAARCRRWLLWGRWQQGL